MISPFLVILSGYGFSQIVEPAGLALVASCDDDRVGVGQCSRRFAQQAARQAMAKTKRVCRVDQDDIKIAF